MIRLCNLVKGPWVEILQFPTHPLNQKRADKNINNSKTKKNMKMLIRMWKYCTTLWFPWAFQMASINDNAQQCPENPSPWEGVSTTDPNSGTTGYHEDKTEMICNVVVQHMWGWQGAITIHNKRECDKCVTTQQVLSPKVNLTVSPSGFGERWYGNAKGGGHSQCWGCNRMWCRGAGVSDKGCDGCEQQMLDQLQLTPNGGCD
jgi:hypothetical protein